MFTSNLVVVVCGNNKVESVATWDVVKINTDTLFEQEQIRVHKQSYSFYLVSFCLPFVLKSGEIKMPSLFLQIDSTLEQLTVRFLCRLEIILCSK